MSGVGIGTVADALSAIQKHVFEAKTFTMGALKKALDENYHEHELLYQVLINKTPHYGNDDDRADALALLAEKILCDEVEKHRDIQGARYYVDLLPTTAHIALGQVTGATPDGRHAGDWLSEGVSPVQGHDRCGPTAAAKSLGKLDQTRCNCCGICVDKCPGGALNLLGRRVTVDAVLTEVRKDAVFYQRSSGGHTLSGGEPTSQPAFAAETSTLV